MFDDFKLFVVEYQGARVAVYAGDTGQARANASVMFFGCGDAAERDQFMIREPEPEESAAFEMRKFAPGGDAMLAIIHL